MNGRVDLSFASARDVFLANEQFFVPRSLASFVYRHKGALRDPALRVALSRAYHSIPSDQSGAPKKVLATARIWR